MKIKAGTIGVWNTLNPNNYLAKPGAKVIVTADCDTAETSLVQVKWIDELATGARRTGDIGRQNDGGYYHEDFEFFEFHELPIYNVNKTVEIVAPQSQLQDIIEIGKMLSVLPFGGEDPLYTRPFIHDACYCAYGWNVVETNNVIDAAVKMNLFKLI